jgi:hypothetical protein
MLNTLLKQAKATLSLLHEDAKAIFVQVLDLIDQSLPLLRDIRVLKGSRVDDLRNLLQVQRKLLEQMAQIELPQDTVFPELVQRFQLIHASLELGTLAWTEEYPSSELLTSSKTVQELMEIFATNPQLTRKIRIWLKMYDLEEKADDIDVIINGLRILTIKMALGDIKDEGASSSYLQQCCRNLIRDMLKSAAPRIESIDNDKRTGTILPAASTKPAEYFSPEPQAEALPFRETIRELLLKPLQQVVQQLEEVCFSLLKQHFLTKFNLDLLPNTPVEPTQGSNNQLYRCRRGLFGLLKRDFPDLIQILSKLMRDNPED